MVARPPPGHCRAASVGRVPARPRRLGGAVLRRRARSSPDCARPHVAAGDTVTIDDEIWAMLPARAPGRQHSAILAELTQTRPGTTAEEVRRAPARDRQSGAEGECEEA